MRKWIGLMACLLLLVGGIFSEASAIVLTPFADNWLYFKNHEGLFDAAGNWKEPGSDVEVGDHLVGIIDLQEIYVGGIETWPQTLPDQLSGVFAERVEAIPPYAGVNPMDPYDPLQTLPHVIFGQPTVQNFLHPGLDLTFGTLDDQPFTTAGLLNAGEIFAFYYDAGAGSTTYEFDGTWADDIQWATDDGTLSPTPWLTLGQSPGLDGIYGTADDDGYLYSHPSLGTPLQNFTGEFWGALNAIQNNTGYPLGGLNDPFESEMDNIIPNLLNDVYFSGELEGNPFSIVGGGGTSPMDYVSNDPAHINPVPEPATMLLLGSGLIGIAGFARRKKSKKVS